MNKLIIAFGLLLIGCANDYELTQSYFEADPKFPGLPKYTELGLNTFGAYVDGAVFVSYQSGYPVKVIAETNKTTFLLNGLPAYYAPNRSQVTALRITIPQTFSDYKSLIALNATEFDLAGAGVEIQVELNNQYVVASVLNGNFHIKRTRDLLVDNVQEEVVLSGTFEFQAIVDGEPIAVTNGRFDLGIGTHNFFKLN